MSGLARHGLGPMVSMYVTEAILKRDELQPRRDARVLRQAPSVEGDDGMGCDGFMVLSLVGSDNRRSGRRLDGWLHHGVTAGRLFQFLE
jgi:hypothetical protein